MRPSALFFLILFFVPLSFFQEGRSLLLVDVGWMNKAVSVLRSPVSPDQEYFKVYPNPAYEMVTIEIGMKLPARISLQMLDSDGKLIRTLADDLFPVGRHFFETTLNSVPSGTYLIRYEKSQKVLVRKVTIK